MPKLEVEAGNAETYMYIDIYGDMCSNMYVSNV